MRLAPLLLTVALAAPLAPVSASSPSVARTDSPSDAATGAATGGVTEIRLVGDPDPAPPKPDGARSKAIERFLSARQDASVDRVLTARLRRELATREQVTDEVLAGPRGGTLIAFDFDDADVPRAGARAERFDVTASLLFASPDGQVVETRDERLTFVPSGGGYACAKIVPTNVISWDSQEALDHATEAGVAREMDHLKAYWRGPADPNRLVAFSLSDVKRASGGDVVISCIRYIARPGRRGYESDTASVVVTKQDGAFRIKSD